MNRMRSCYYEFIFADNSTRSEQSEFTDDLLHELEQAGVNAGGVQNRLVLEVSMDYPGEDDLSPVIEEHIRSNCAKYPCVAMWRRMDESEML